MNGKVVWMAAGGLTLSAALIAAWFMHSPVQLERSPIAAGTEPIIAEVTLRGAKSRNLPTTVSGLLSQASTKPSRQEVERARNPPPIDESLRREWNEGEVDRTASDKWTRHFAEALEELEIDGALDGLLCTKSLCRIDFHFSNLGEAMRFQNAAGMPERRRGIEVTMTDGQVDVEVLMAHEDTPKSEP